MTLRGHTSAVNDVAVTPGGRHVVSGSSDSTLRIWNLKNGKETPSTPNASLFGPKASLVLLFQEGLSSYGMAVSSQTARSQNELKRDGLSFLRLKTKSRGRLWCETTTSIPILSTGITGDQQLLHYLISAWQPRRKNRIKPTILKSDGGLG
jgi:WD40 repeat protein